MFSSALLRPRLLRSTSNFERAVAQIVFVLVGCYSQHIVSCMRPLRAEAQAFAKHSALAGLGPLDFKSPNPRR